MLLSLIAVTALAVPATLPPTPDDAGQVTWFEGTYEEALAQAAAEDRLVLIDFWTDWCVWCKRLDADVFSQAEVGAALGELICLSLDAEGLAGAPIAKRFNVTGFPTLLLLNPDGSIRDLIGGYLPPAEFIAEIERIRADEGTVSALRRAVDADPVDIEARYELAVKLRDIGDAAGYDAQFAEIERLDPEGRSLPMRRLRFAEINRQVDAQAGSGQYADVEDLLAFLAEETDPDLLFEGYFLGWRIEEFHSRLSALDGSEPELVAEYLARQLEMARGVWEHVSADLRPLIGNQLAWTAWEARDSISDEHKAFALELARAAHATDLTETSYLDTLGCVLFMNGDRAGALERVHSCIELDPDNELWKSRLEEFEAQD